MVRVKKEYIERYVELESSLEKSDVEENPQKVIETALKSGIATLSVEEKNKESDELSIKQEQERLAEQVFSSSKEEESTDSAGLSDDPEISEIQEDLKRRIFDN